MQIIQRSEVREASLARLRDKIAALCNLKAAEEAYHARLAIGREIFMESNRAYMRCDCPAALRNTPDLWIIKLLCDLHPDVPGATELKECTITYLEAVEKGEVAIA